MPCVIIEENMSHVKKIKFDWTSAADGTATGTTVLPYSGKLERLVTIPSSTAAPTALYDIVINDEDNTDALMGGGADRSATAKEQVAASSLGIVANDRLSISVTNAGAAKSGTAILYIK